MQNKKDKIIARLTNLSCECCNYSKLIVLEVIYHESGQTQLNVFCDNCGYLMTTPLFRKGDVTDLALDRLKKNQEKKK